MTPEQARHLATRYKNTWRGGPHSDELVAQFTRLDTDRLTTVLGTLARSSEHPPSIAAIIRGYDEQGAPTIYGWQKPVDTGPAVSLDEHIARLEWRVGTGDHQAITELDGWRRLRAQSVACHPSTTGDATQPTLGIDA